MLKYLNKRPLSTRNNCCQIQSNLSIDKYWHTLTDGLKWWNLFETDVSNILPEDTVLSWQLFEVWLKMKLGKMGMGLPWWLSGKESACNAGDLSSVPGLRRSPWEWNGYPLTVFWPGESLRQRALVAYSPYGCRESDITERLTLTQQWEYSILKDHRKEFSLFAGGRWWWSFQCHLTRSQWFSTLDPGKVRNKELLSSILGLIANRAHTVCSHWGQCVDILVSVCWWPVQVVSAAWLVYLYGGKC